MAHSAVWCWQQSWWTMVDHFLKLLNCRNFRGTLVSCQMDGRTLVGQKTGVFFNLKNLLVHPQLFLRHTDALDTLVHLCLNYSDELEKMFWLLQYPIFRFRKSEQMMRVTKFLLARIYIDSISAVAYILYYLERNMIDKGLQCSLD